MNQQELLQLIDRAAAEEWTELDLNSMGLTGLPPEIGQLTKLTTLNLGGNRLAAIPPEIIRLTNLKALDLGGNWLRNVPPEIMQLTGLTELYLYDNGLKSLPPEIGWLTNLTTLNLYENRLTSFPLEIGQLVNLTTLNLYSSGLKVVPLEIVQLTNLTSINLGGNQLTTVPPEIRQLTKLTSLKLNYNHLSVVPAEIGELASLVELDLSYNQLLTVPPEIGQLINLIGLNLSDNQLAFLPPEIGQLSSLTWFDLTSNELTTVPPEIGRLISLAELDLSNNQLTAVPAEMGQLTSLAKLDLDHNELADIPPEISQLTSLSSLDLRSNQLMALPLEICKLISLTSLYLQNNKLTVIPPEIDQLGNLASLSLSGNALTVVPPEIGNLSSLISLKLYNNKLTTLPLEISQLTGLTLLNLSSNQLEAVPPEIGHLSSLTSLILYFNQLTILPPEIGQLTSLTELSLDVNKLTVVPVEIGQLTNLTQLDLSWNQLEYLPETLQQLRQVKELDLRGNHGLGISQEVLETKNPSLILKTYFGERRPLHEAKMLLVGQAGVGKTALARRLLHDLPPDEAQGKTSGVDIQKWSLVPAGTDTPITLNLWDFGGQGVYQATHQFFFTSRSLYLVVINARTGEQESRLRHWLKLVGSLSDNAPVIIVVNKQDEHALSLNERELKHKYPNLLHIIPTSCTTGQGIPELREAIAEALSQLPHLNDQFPIAWFGLKAQLEAMDTNYITYERYAEYCREAGIDNRADQRSWVQVLHQLGVVLNYRDDNYRQLEGTHVLKPEWVTDGVYRILSDPDNQIAYNSGILTAATLDNILDPDDYPRHQQHFIVAMMQKFELSFRIPNRQDQYLIPDLLPNTQPDLAAIGFALDAPALQLEIHYTEFLPSSILSRFMVGMMATLDRQASWRQGAVLDFDGNHALVRADLEARKLFITITGTEATRRSLLNTVRMQLHAIHSTFPNLPLSEQVPIPGHPGITIDYDELLWYESEAMLNPPYAPIRGKIDIKALLDGIETPTLRRERQIVEQLRESHNLEELQDLCDQLDINYENLPGQTLSAKTRELVQLMGRQGRLNELESRLRSGRSV